MRRVDVSGKTVELAVADGLRQLNIGRDRAEVIVKVAPSRGFLGFGARNADVEVRVIENPVADGERFLREMFVAMRLSVRVSTLVDETNTVTFQLSGDRVGLLIGKHGQTLDAIQYLVNAVANKYVDKHVHFIVDAEGYRQRRRQALIYSAQKTAAKALALGHEIMMEPMIAQDRKIIHIALQDRLDIQTESRGSEPDRAIVVIPKVHRRIHAKTR